MVDRLGDFFCYYLLGRNLMILIYVWRVFENEDQVFVYIKEFKVDIFFFFQCNQYDE